MFEIANAWRAENGLSPIEATTQSMLDEAAADSKAAGDRVTQLTNATESSDSEDHDSDQDGEVASGSGSEGGGDIVKQATISAVNEQDVNELAVGDGDDDDDDGYASVTAQATPREVA